jgi:DNA-binding GntR family transcriptional regulator
LTRDSKNSRAVEGAPVRIRGAGRQTVYDEVRQSIIDLTVEPGVRSTRCSSPSNSRCRAPPFARLWCGSQAEGLVTTLPNRNTHVSVIDFGRLPIYFEAWTLMYRVTTRGAAAHRQADDLVGIERFKGEYAEAVIARDALKMIQANRDFHVAIATAAGNPYFTALFERLLDEGRRILRLYYQSFDDRLPRQYIDEQETMVAAIVAEDADRADEIATVHAAQIMRQIESYVARDTTAKLDLRRAIRP